MASSDTSYRSSEFQKFFKGASRSLILKADAPRFTPNLIDDCRADGYIEKPFAIEELANIVDSYLRLN
jgi:hypothetical protein